VLDRVGSLAKPIRVNRARRFDIDWIDTHACDWPDYIRVWLQQSADKARRRYGLSSDADASDPGSPDPAPIDPPAAGGEPNAGETRAE
jgi:hypothetical protein